MGRVRLLGTLIAIALMSAACGPVDWPMIGFGPAHTGSSSDTTIAASDLAGFMVNDWTAILDHAASPPVVVNDRVYVTVSNALDALDTTHSNCYYYYCFPVWHGSLAANATGAPAYAGGVVYAGAGDQRVYAFDAAGQAGCSSGTCLPLRTYAANGAIVGSPVVAGGVLYVVTSTGFSGQLLAFSAAGTTNCTGTPVSCTPLWTAAVPSTIGAPPAVANGNVYLDAGKLYVFDAAGTTSCSGTPKVCHPLWSTTPPAVTETSSPVVAGGIAFVGTTAFDSAGSTNCAGSPKTCGSLFTLQAPGPYHPSPAVAGGTAYVTASDSKMYAFDATGHTACTGAPKTCASLWTTSGSVGPLTSSPSIANGIVYVSASNGHVYAFDAAGSNQCSGMPIACSAIWSAATGQTGVVGSPTVSHGHVYVPSADPNLYAFRPDHAPPTTSITSPRAGSMLAASVTVDAYADDDSFLLSKVEVRVTGGAYQDALLGDASEHDGTWAFQWNTTTVPNGPYTLHTVAYDSVGNHTESVGVDITVSN